MELSVTSNIKKKCEKRPCIFNAKNVELLNKTNGTSLCRLLVSYAMKKQGNYKTGHRKGARPNIEVDELIIKNEPGVEDEVENTTEVFPDSSLPIPPLVPLQQLSYTSSTSNLDATSFEVMATDFSCVPPLVPLSFGSMNAQENENSIIKLEGFEIKTELPDCEQEFIDAATTTTNQLWNNIDMETAANDIKTEPNIVLEDNHNQAWFQENEILSAEMAHVQTVSNFEITYVSEPETKRPLSAAGLAKVKKSPMTVAERAKKYREKKKLTKVKKIPMTSLERQRNSRARRKAARLEFPLEVSSSANQDAGIECEHQYEHINSNHLQVELPDCEQEEQQKSWCSEPMFPDSSINNMEMSHQFSNFEITFISEPEHEEVKEKRRRIPTQPKYIMVDEKKRAMTTAERTRKWRARKKATEIKTEVRENRVRTPAMTATERTRKRRALMKAAKNAIPFEHLSNDSFSSSGVSAELQNVNQEEQHVDEMVINSTMEDPTISSQIKETESKESTSMSSTEINCESNENEKSLEICTEPFSQPVLCDCVMCDEILENEESGRRKTPMTQAERSRKHRAMKKARENAIPFELIAMNNDTSDVMETVLTEDNAIAKIKVKFPLNSEERDILYKRYAIIDEYIKSRKPKRLAMTAAERMRLYRRRKKEAQNKS